MRFILSSLALGLLQFSAYTNSANDDNFRVVSTEYGLIRGEKLLSFLDGKAYWSFKGIPYAKPPVDDLRYKVPQTPDRWSGIRDTMTFGNSCVQASRNDRFLIIGKEDCLYLNVYIPVKVDSQEKLPVMLFIHGGGYYYGTSTSYGPDFLVANDVILVTFNYRLGVLGFLSLGTGEYPGNMGMKDQLEAIKWVNRNIEHFGGDPTKVTLFGESAGAASTHLHMLSPASRGLFQRAIIQSGSVFNNWAFSEATNNLNHLHRIANRFGQNVRNNEELMNFYKKVDGETLIRESNQLFEVPSDARNNTLIWLPLVEVSESKKPFFSKTVVQYLKEPNDDKFDTLIGHTSAEMFFAAKIMQKPELLEPINNNFMIQMPWSQRIPDYDSTTNKAASREVRNFYFPNNAKINENTLPQYSNFMDDLYFNVAQYMSALVELDRSKNMNVCYYLFSIETDLNVPRSLNGLDKLGFSGVAHIDDLFYIFKLTDEFDPFYYYNYDQLTPNSEEVHHIRAVSQIWTDFAKYGNPSKIFQPFTLNARNYVNLTNVGPIPSVNPLDDRMRFWEKLYQKYENKPDAKLNRSNKNEL